MTNAEFSNEFDVLYNSITSNQAPGLDEYEKSVFLTKAQDEIVKSYFNPRSNKTQEGYDDNERRQIDFSMIMRSVRYRIVNFTVSDETTGPTYTSIKNIDLLDHLVESQDGSLTTEQFDSIDKNCIRVTNGPHMMGKPQTFIADPFFESFFDYRDNTKSVVLDESVLMFVNEYVSVIRGSQITRLTVVPINYVEYSRLMSKPHKRPLKFQAWRILDNSATGTSSGSAVLKKAELVIGPNDTIREYVARYVKRPRAIRLITFDDVTLDGSSEEQSCELDPILHEEILQRAVELAKAAYTGDLQSQVALGQASQTNIGAVQTSR